MKDAGFGGHAHVADQYSAGRHVRIDGQERQRSVPFPVRLGVAKRAEVPAINRARPEIALPVPAAAMAHRKKNVRSDLRSKVVRKPEASKMEAKQLTISTDVMAAE